MKGRGTVAFAEPALSERPKGVRISGSAGASGPRAFSPMRFSIRLDTIASGPRAFWHWRSQSLLHSIANGPRTFSRRRVSTRLHPIASGPRAIGFAWLLLGIEFSVDGAMTVYPVPPTQTETALR